MLPHIILVFPSGSKQMNTSIAVARDPTSVCFVFCRPCLCICVYLYVHVISLMWEVYKGGGGTVLFLQFIKERSNGHWYQQTAGFFALIFLSCHDPPSFIFSSHLFTPDVSLNLSRISSGRNICTLRYEVKKPPVQCPQYPFLSPFITADMM